MSSHKQKTLSKHSMRMHNIEKHGQKQQPQKIFEIKTTQVL